MNDYDLAAGRIFIAFGGVVVAASGLSVQPTLRRVVFGLGAAVCSFLLLTTFLAAYGSEKTTSGLILVATVVISFAVDRWWFRRRR